MLGQQTLIGYIGENTVLAITQGMTMPVSVVKTTDISLSHILTV